MRHLIITALICVSAGFLGYWSRPKIPEPDSPSAGSPRGFPTSLTEILAGRRATDHLGRWEATLDLAENPPEPEQWPTLLERVRTDPFAAEQIVRTWIRNDPAACWAHLLVLGEGGLPPRSLAEAAALTWAASDPESALAAINALPVSAISNAQERLRNDLRWLALREALSHDMDHAFALVATTLDGDGIAFGSSDTWVEQDPGKACRLLASLPNTAFRHAIGQAARTWFQQDSEAALAWALNAPVGIQRECFDYIARDLKESRDIETLKALALATSSMSVRSEVADGLFDLWLADSPNAAFDWLGEHFEGFISRSVANNAMSNLVWESRDTADFATLTALAERLPPGYARGGAAYPILQRWTRENPDAAIAYAESLDPASRSSAYKDLAANWAQHSSATEWLQSAPDIPIAKSLLHHVIQKRDTASLEELIPQLPPARAAVVREALDSR